MNKIFIKNINKFKNTKTSSFNLFGETIEIIQNPDLLLNSNERIGHSQYIIKYGGNTYLMHFHIDKDIAKTADLTGGYQVYQNISLSYFDPFLSNKAASSSFYKHEHKTKPRTDETLLQRLIGRSLKAVENKKIQFNASVYMETLVVNNSYIDHFTPLGFALGWLCWINNLITDIPLSLTFWKENSSSPVLFNQKHSNDISFVQYSTAWTADSLVSISGQSGSTTEQYSYDNLYDDLMTIYNSEVKKFYEELYQHPEYIQYKKINDTLAEEQLVEYTKSYKQIEEVLGDKIKDFFYNFRYISETRAKFECLEMCNELNIEHELSTWIIEHYIYDILNNWLWDKRLFHKKALRGSLDFRTFRIWKNNVDDNQSNIIFARGSTKLILTMNVLDDPVYQLVHTPNIRYQRTFMLYYVFNAFLTGVDTRFDKYIKPRELGHGDFVRKAVGRTIEVSNSIYATSSCIQSDGSSSLLTAIATGYSLWTMGLTSKKIAGIAIGVNVLRDEKFNSYKRKYIVDLTEFEDHKGSLDFKVIGTKDGVCGIQMDASDYTIIKVTDLSRVLAMSRLLIRRLTRSIYADSSAQSPSTKIIHDKSFYIDSSLVGIFIGKKGANINWLIDRFKLDINVGDTPNDKNEVEIILRGTTKNINECLAHLSEKLINKPVIGEIYDLKCTKVYGNKVEFSYRNSVYRWFGTYKIGIEPSQMYKGKVTEIDGVNISVTLV